MPRTKIDFHKDGADAEAAISALREVGLSPDDVGGAWRFESTMSQRPNDEAGALITRRVVDVAQIGRVEFSGWLADAAQDASTSSSNVSLAAILRSDVSEADEVTRIHDTLLSGGGIVGVRARDTFSAEPG